MEPNRAQEQTQKQAESGSHKVVFQISGEKINYTARGSGATD